MAVPGPAIRRWPGRSSRLFPELGPAGETRPRPEDLGAPGGVMDSGYTQVSNFGVPAGYTYFAQFVFHDLTLGSPPRLDLRTIYGNGPSGSRLLYDPARPALLREGVAIGPGGRRDVPRDPRGQALIADPRNDRTLLLAQLHAVFARLHNTVCRSLFRGDWSETFRHARATIVRRYQWLVANDLLPRLVGASFLSEVNGGKTPLGPRLARSTGLPVEFTLAVGRFGHSMPRPRYVVNGDFEAPLLRDEIGPSPLRDLRGQPLNSRAAVEWERFFDLGDPMKVQASGRLNTRICKPLFHFPIPGAGTLQRSVPYRTLVACRDAGVPSGQDVAAAMRCAVVPEDALWGSLPYRGRPAPLWFYVLREAEHQHHGERLGSVGAGIVAGVLHHVLLRDRRAYPQDPATRLDFTLNGLTTVGHLVDATVSGSKSLATLAGSGRNRS